MALAFYQILWCIMKESFFMAKKKGKVKWYCKMEIYMWDYLQIINLMAKESINGQMAKYMMDSFIMDSKMASESIPIETKIHMKACISWIRDTGRAYIDGAMDQSTKDNFKTMKSMFISYLEMD